ncbi:MAG: HAD-IC family P-type ATPase [Thermoleophilia bacterium]|nr:HAD-IC family P-type ATPase [Thermoleophilia bacterium]
MTSGELTTELHGLSRAEVDERVADGRVNAVPDAPSRTLAQIVLANVVTPVNGIIGTLFVLILVAGYPQDALFVGVVVSNSVIGIVQELRARRELNRLAVLSAPKARAIREAVEHEIAVGEVVEDDVIAISPGDQIVVDGDILATGGLEVDESLLTGESEPVEKAVGEQVMSGSFVAAGSGHYRATHVGPDAYAARLAEEARRFTLVDSELRTGVNLILKWLVVIIPPVSVLLLLRLLHTEPRWEDALQGTVAAAVAMVPDGLVLLTSIAFLAGVLALARRQALAKELASVELLARVDTLCLDKTGTITTGAIAFSGALPLGHYGEGDVAAALGAMAGADPTPNPTLAAIAAEYPQPEGWRAGEVVPFSSARKWAAASFDGRGAYFLGAPDILLMADDQAEAERVADHAAQGRRTLLLARAADLDGDELPELREPVALILLEDQLREDAPEILAYFRDQGVDLKVISGDHAETVAAVSRKAGVAGAQTGIDARTLPAARDALGEVMAANAVFGRVTPHQKQEMVGALQDRGHVVAMTGDGVNDVLALKDADMGIAMGAGSSATRAVAQLVLLDNAFATLPRVLAEGRKVINNVERVANLFISKATYAVLLTLLTTVVGSPFPFLPRQLTLIGTFSIGVPGFFLALAPSERLVQPGFLDRVLRFSLPAGTAAALAAFVCFEVLRGRDDVSLEEARTAATIVLLAVGLVILLQISRPIQPWKVGLVAGMGATYVAVMAIPWLHDFFELHLPPPESWPTMAIAAAIGALGVVYLPRLLPWARDLE